MKDHIKFLPYRILARPFHEYSNFVRDLAPTMGKTEETLRITQFVAGVIAARDAGMLSDKNIWEYEGEELEMAIEIGRKFVQMAAFSVGRENIGEISRGEIGSFLTKFKYFGIQKFGSDVDKSMNAFLEVKAIADKGEGSTLKELSRFFGSFG